MYIDKYGLTNSKAYEIGAENGILWTLEHIILEGYKKPRIAALMNSIDKCRVGQGLYMQNPSHVENGVAHQKDLYMSPDQLIAIMLASYKFGGNHHVEIFNEIKKQGWVKYNNIGDNKKRFIHPRDLVLYMSLNYPKLGNLLLIVLSIACVITCLKGKEHTSGKLLAWTKCQMLKDDFIIMRMTLKLCSLCLKFNNKSWENVFKVYFKEHNHPIRKLIRG